MSETGIVCFLDYALDAANSRLHRGAASVPLRPKTLALLSCLAARPGRLVTKEELLDAVWPGTAVSDWVITSTVKELRDALADDARRPRVIETVHRRGYRFVAAVTAGASPAAIAVPPAGPRPELASRGSRLIGRGADLERLTGWWREALAGERQTVFVIGEAGIGKTTLVDELLDSLGSARTFLVARGQCIEQRGAGEPYLPVLEALGRLATQPDAGTVVDALRRHAPAWLVQLPGLLDAEECEALERRLGTSTRDRMLREIAALVAALPVPLLLVLEDLHWSDQPTIDLVATLSRRRDRARLLLVGTYRPVDVAVHDHPLRTVHQDLRAHGCCRDLWLAPLTEAATAEYLRARWPGVGDVGDLARFGHERTDGNPLFLVNLADYFEATGAVVAAGGGWVVEGDPARHAGDVPPGLRELISAQIERLDDAERAALEAGSIAGRSFSAALVAAALESDVVGTERCLSALAHVGLMVGADGTSTWPDGTVAGAYRFNHFLYQSVLRDRVPPAARRELHARMAARLERAHGGHSADASAEMAFHFEAGGDAERAVPHLLEAGTRALHRGANRESAATLERALAIVDALPRTPERTLRTIRLCLTLGPALEPTQGWGGGRMEELYERARRLSEESDDPIQLFQSLIALTGTYMGTGRLQRAVETVARLQALLAALPIPAFEFAGTLFAGMVTCAAGDLSEGQRLLERAVSLDDVPMPATSVDMRAMARGYLGLALAHRGRPDEARARLRDAAARAATGERPFDRALIAQICCSVHLLLGDLDALPPFAEQALACDDFPAVAAYGRLSHGRVLSARGDHEHAVATMREAIDAYRATGQRVGLPTMLAALVEGHAVAGDGATAIACVAEARAAAASLGEVRYLAELDRLEGTLHLAAGDRRAAEELFLRAVATAREQGAGWWELRATTSLARLALDTDPPAAARGTSADELARLVASFTQGADLRAVREARDLVTELRAPG